MTPGGRKKTVSALVVVGNKKGAVGMYIIQVYSSLCTNLHPYMHEKCTSFVPLTQEFLCFLYVGFAIGKGDVVMTAIRKVHHLEW